MNNFENNVQISKAKFVHFIAEKLLTNAYKMRIIMYKGWEHEAQRFNKTS